MACFYAYDHQSSQLESCSKEIYSTPLTLANLMAYKSIVILTIE